MTKKVFKSALIFLMIISVVGAYIPVFAQDNEQSESYIYKSSDCFSSSNENGVWNNGLWKAQKFDKETGTYSLLQSFGDKANRAQSGSGDAKVYYGNHKDNSPSINGWWMSTGNNGGWTPEDDYCASVKTFVAPKSGYVTISFADKLYSATNTSPDVKITVASGGVLNKIWPQNDDFYTLTAYSYSTGATTYVDETVTVFVKKGDEINFEVHIPSQTSTLFSSKVHWDPVISYNSLVVEGKVTNTLTGPVLDIKTSNLMSDSVVLVPYYSDDNSLINVEILKGNLNQSIALDENTQFVKIITLSSINDLIPVNECIVINKDEFAKLDAIEVYFNDTQIEYENQPYYFNSKTKIVPFKETLEAFGLSVEYNSVLKKYTSKINGYEISVTEGSDIVEYDMIDFEMAYTIGDNSVIYVDAEIFDKVYGFDITENENCVYISGNLEQDNSLAVSQYLESITDKTTVISNSDLFSAGSSSSDLMTKETVNISDLQGYEKAVELVNLTEPEVYYNVQLKMPTNAKINKDDIVVMEFWAKMINTDDELQVGTINAVLETLDGNYTKYVNKTEYVPNTWTRIRHIFKVTSDIESGGAQVGLRIGFSPQTLRIAGFSLINYGTQLDVSKLGDEYSLTAAYHGMEDGALWREEALKRIEKYRVRNIDFNIVDSFGNAIENAKVTANMVKSEFIWGSAINPSKMFNTDNVSESEWYKATVKNNFNSVVMETGMKTASFNMDKINSTSQFVSDNDMYFRAHTVLWDNEKYFTDVELASLTEQEAFDYLYNHAAKILNNMGSNVNEIDAINEPLHNNYLQNKFGKEFAARLLKSISDMVDEINPEIDIFVNEGLCATHSQWSDFKQLAKLVQKYIELGGVVDGIGMQNHLTEANYPQEFYKQIDYLSKYVDKLAITEYDFDSGFIDSNKKSETIEAKHLRDMMIVAYSHPDVTGFTMWGFTDDGHWRENAPLYYANHTEKSEALAYWNEYVKDKWFTSASLLTDKDGCATIRGHRGLYDITIEINGVSKTIKLDVGENSNNSVNVVFEDGNINVILPQ